MKTIKYGIYLPKFYENNMYYKSIITFCIENDKIIGAKEWDFQGNNKVVSYIDLLYSKSLVTNDNSGIQEVTTDELIKNTNREIWLFSSEEQAYAQKIWAMKKIRDWYYMNREQERKMFDLKIPELVENQLAQIRVEKPEYFL
jgi:hypothetical protein